MLPKLITLAIFSFFFSFSSWAYRSPGSYFQLQSDLGKISQKNLIDYLNGLVKASVPTRMVSTPGHTAAVEYLKDTILKLDPKSSGKLEILSFSPDVSEAKKFYQNDFTQKVEGKFPKTDPNYQKWLRFTTYMQQTADRLKNSTGKNIVWEKTGLNPNKVLIITAHYDTISHDPQTYLIKEKDPMPGANYNASGVAVALGLIKTMAEFDINYSVKVVFLDWQGVGFLGSYQYAKELKEMQKNGKTIMGIVNLEMLGQDSTYYDKTKKSGNMKVYTRPVAEEERFAKKLIEHGSHFSKKISFDLLPNSFENSDNFRFWDQGLTCATFSQNWEDDFNPKFYQTPQDTPETLNHETLYQAYLYLGGAVVGTLLDLSK